MVNGGARLLAASRNLLEDLVVSCGEARDLAAAKRAHATILSDAPVRRTYLGNRLVEMYGKCGSADDAAAAFLAIAWRNSHSWAILHAALAHTGHLADARALFDLMPAHPLVAWNTMIAAANDAADAREIFDCLPERTVVSWTALLAAYAAARDPDAAQAVFAAMPSRNAISWNALLGAFVEDEDAIAARRVFDRAPAHTLVSWSSLMAGYAQSGHHHYRDYAAALFAIMPERDIIAWSILISSARGEEEALAAFSRMPGWNHVAWNSLILARSASGHLPLARSLFDAMPERTPCAWNTMIDCCASAGDLAQAKELFDRAVPRSKMTWNILVAASAELGSERDAEAAMARMPAHDIISWNTIAGALARWGRFHCALAALAAMPELDSVSWIALLQAHVLGSDATATRAVFDRMPRHNGAAIAIVIQKYAALGGRSSALQAWKVFAASAEPGLAAWNGMIAALASGGEIVAALELFHRMLAEGIAPDDVTILQVIAACSQSGSLILCERYARVAVDDLGAALGLDHYHCLLDALGRAGEMRDAQELLAAMPFQPVALSWKTLLGACQTHLDPARARAASRFLIEDDDARDRDSTPYVLLFNIAARSMMDRAARS